MEAILRRRRALGVRRDDEFNGVIAGDPEVLEKLRGRGATHADGHAPGVMGRAMSPTPLAAGIRSDHEARLRGGARKRRAAWWVLIREASNARNARALLQLVGRPRPAALRVLHRRPASPNSDCARGTSTRVCRIAVEEGVAAEDALLLAAGAHRRSPGLDDRGAIGTGTSPILLCRDLSAFRPSW